MVLRAERDGQQTDVAGVAAYGLAMLAKEHAIMLLPVLVFADALGAPPGGAMRPGGWAMKAAAASCSTA